MSKYWNGYQWVEYGDVFSQQEHQALLEAELMPRTITEEEVPVEVVTDVSYADEDVGAGLPGQEVERDERD